MSEFHTVIKLGDRLLFLIQELKKWGITDEEGKMNSGAFARSIGIAPPQFSRVTNNELQLTLDQVMKVCYIYNVRTGWLLEGEEPIFHPKGPKYINKEKSDAKAPDPILLTQLKTQATDLLASLHTLLASSDVPEEENVDQASVFPEISSGKSQTADKQ